jgi:CMP-N,N'-diacetyllegionaminic acid synthase
MYEGHSILGIIPARGGSKGLPNKNIRECAGMPLIGWSIQAAAGSLFLDRAVVSTDSPEIAKVAAACGGDVPFLRPEHLASDTAAILDAINHTIDSLKAAGEKYDYVVLLQPTSPLRTSADIDGAIQRYFEGREGPEDTLVSVFRVDAKYALLMYRNHAGFLDLAVPIDVRNPRRQELPECFLPNGAIYIGALSYLTRSFYSERTVIYEMAAERSVDVDRLEDLEVAARLLREHGRA